MKKLIIIFFALTTISLAQAGLNRIIRYEMLDSILTERGLIDTSSFRADVDSLYTKTSQIIKPEMYGGNGNGAFNNSTVFSNLLSDWTDGNVLTLEPNAVYAFDDSISIQCDSSIIIEGNGATFDFTNVEHFFPIQFLGSTNTAYSIPNAYSQGSYKIKAPTEIADSVSRGSMVLITSDASWGGVDVLNDYDINSHKGELVEVLSVSNDTLTLTHTLYNSYIGNDTTKIVRLNMPRVIIRDLNIVGTVGSNSVLDRMIGLTIGTCKDVEVSNVKVNGVEHTGLYIYRSYNVTVDKFSATDFYNDIGNNYGVVFAGVFNGSITNSKVYGGRHAIDISSYSDYLGSTAILVRGNILNSDYDAALPALSTHPNCRYIRFENNYISGYSGISVRSADIDIVNNTVIEDYTIEQGSGISFNLATASTYGYVNIIGNTIKGYLVGISTTIIPTCNIGKINISGNHIIPNDGDYQTYAIRVSKYTATQTGSISGLRITDNVLTAKGNTLNNIIDLGYTPTDTLYIEELSISNNSMSGENEGVSISSMKVKDLIISNNFMKTDQAILSVNSVLSNVEITSNYIDRYNNGSNPVFSIDASTNFIRFQNNTIKCFTATDTLIDLTADTIYYGGAILNDCDPTVVEKSLVGEVVYTDAQDRLTITAFTDSTAYLKKGSFLIDVVDYVSPPTLPLPLLRNTINLDSINVDVYDSSFTWKLYKSNSWTTLADSVLPAKTTTTHTSYTDFTDDLILKNNKFYLDITGYEGTLYESMSMEVFFTKENFYPSELNPIMWLRKTKTDAENKITEWTDLMGDYDFTQADTSLSPIADTDTVTFDSTAYLGLADASAGDLDFGTNDISVEVWMKYTDSGAIEQLITKYAGTNPRWLLEVSSGSAIFIARANADTVGSLNSQTTNLLNDGEWHHIVVTFDRDVGSDMYIDGVLKASEHTTEWTDMVSTDFDNATDAFIGITGSGTQYYNGDMFSVRFYLTALTKTQVLQLYNYGLN